MVRAFGLLALSLVALVGLLGCEGEHAVGPAAAPATAAKSEALDASPYATPPVAMPTSDPLAIAPSALAPAVDALGRPLPEEAKPHEGRGPGEGGDKFALIEENQFLAVKDAPLSTFSIDVDTASYSKMRAFLLQSHMLPPADAVRIEELINYFDYDYAGPTDEHPFAVHLETAECPWQPQHRLVRCALQGKKLDGNRPVSNLVFLIDVSGSMNQANKLPLVQRALNMLVTQLGENDRVSIVVYAGAAGMVLPPTPGTERATITAAIDNLRAGGSTNGGQGIQLAYKLAQENFIKGGTNRVILCSDGDFNVGVTSTGDLIRMAKEKADLGIYLSVLGFGIGNHNDAMLEELSNKANGNYAFIDSDAEARKVFIEQMEGTLVTIAKDVKIQVEFNPAQVAAYRLIGYENRKLADRDFNDDKKDAGDIGAGHRVTALYEIVPVGVESKFTKPLVDPLKYQGAVKPEAQAKELTEAAQSGELLTLKLRYQPPSGGPSTLLTFPVKDSQHRFVAASQDFQFAAAVASFGQLLRGSKYKGSTSYAAVLETATAARGTDKNGLRGEFLQLVSVAMMLDTAQSKEPPTAPVDGAAPLGAAPLPGAWIRPEPGVAQSYPPSLAPVIVPSPAFAFPFLYIFFFAGLLVGIAAAVVVVLCALGLLNLRARWLANPLPPPKKGSYTILSASK